MSNNVYLVTGANKGIGFNTVLALLKDPKTIIIAAVREPQAALDLQDLVKSTGRVFVVEMDVGNFDSVKASFDVVASLPPVVGHGIDVLFANAGFLIGPEVPASRFNTEDTLSMLQVNTFGAIYVAQVFLPLLRLGTKKTIMYNSSIVGSTTVSWAPEGAGGALVGYGMSKAAGNHYFKRLHQELKEEDFIVICYHPGAVATTAVPHKAGVELGSGVKVISPDEAGQAVANILTSRTLLDSGKFFTYEGEEMAW